MIYNLGLFNDIGNAIVQALRTFSGYIIAIIYELIAYLYKIFELLGTAEILDNDFVNAIYRKVGLILGLFMLFKLLFSFIQSLIDPNKLTDSNKGPGAIIKRLVISIVLLGITPFLFREAFKLQRLLIGADNSSNNVLYKLIVGGTTGINVDNFGRELSTNVLFTFYTDNDYPKYDDGKDEYDENLEERYQELNYNSLKENVKKGSSFFDIVPPLSFRTDNVYEIEFNFFLALIVGVALLYIVFMFCFQTAARVFQLAFLQLIAPIPILSYISDPDGTFKKWIQKCLWTFLELFIRLTIIYFVIFLSTYIFTQIGDANSILMESLGDEVTNDKILLSLIQAFLVLGLFMFANNVPKLLKEIFPSMGGDFKLGLNAKKDVIEPIKSMANNPIGRLATKPIKWAGGKVAAPIKKGLETRKNNRTAMKEANAQARENKAKFGRGQSLFEKYGDNIENAFTGDYATSYNKLKEAKKNAGKMENIFNAASDDLKEARKSGDATRIQLAQEAYDKANKNKRDADKWVEEAKKRHDVNKKRYYKQAQMEDDYDYYKTREKISGLVSGTTNQQTNSNSSTSTGNTGNNGSQPTPPRPASAPSSTSVVDRVNDITGVNRSAASDNGAPTAENSLLAQLAEQSHQENMQREFMNRGSVESSSPRVLPPTEEQMDNYIKTPAESRNFNYDSQQEWDDRIEFATERLQELASNGASEKEVEYQKKVLENLQEAKKQSAQKEQGWNDNLDDFYDRQNDGFGGQ